LSDGRDGLNIDIVFGGIHTASEAALILKDNSTWLGVATYVLWDRKSITPIYCGTAKTPTRLRGHLHKDDLANRPIGKTHVNPELRAYCLAQPKGWLGVSFVLSKTENEAREIERTIIAHYGLRKLGGQLFNQRMSG
jgi:hypothetical protein